MKSLPLKYSSQMNLSGESSSRMDHLRSKRNLSDRLREEKSRTSNNTANKRMKHHQERRFGSSSRANGFSPSSSSSSSDHDNDDDYDNDNASPFNLAKPAPKNSTTPSNSCRREDEKTQHKPQIGKKEEHRKAVPVVVQDDDDSSSTSNCSSEQHSNDDKDDEDFHEKLDYDDDSITDSPLCSSLPSNHNNNSNHIPVSSSERSSSATATAPDEKDETDVCASRIDHQQNEQPKLSDETPEETDPRPPPTQHRLKSVIYSNCQSSIRDSSHRSPKRPVCDDKLSLKSYNSLLRYLFKDACFFQMKSINHENIKLSKSMGIWSTPIPNEMRLNAAFKEHRNVILIFSVQQSGGFQGFARMVSISEPATRPLPWVLPERLNSNALRGVFKVQWICKQELPFHIAQDLHNPYNDNKPIKVARDGQQVESRTGKKLCKLFPEEDKDQLLEVVSLMKHQTSQRKKYPHRYENEAYPFAYRPGLETMKRNPTPTDNYFQYHHHHHGEHHRRPHEHQEFNYQHFESNGPPNYYNSYPRLPPGPYHHQHHHHHQPYPHPNPHHHHNQPLHTHHPPHPHPMDQYPPPDMWLERPVMPRHHNRDYRPKR